MCTRFVDTLTQPMQKNKKFLIGIDEAGRAAPKRGEPRPAFIIGIDEAGRGPLAGPVVVGGVKIVTRDLRHITRLLKGIRDSKKLCPHKREFWFKKLMQSPHIVCASVKISPRVIDTINIAQATNLGVRRVYERLSQGRSYYTGLDGSLYLLKHIPHKTIIKGDEKIPLISAASIIAKVMRDRLMRRLHKKYPQYRFDIHKGYGTKLHRELLKKYGSSEVHRKSFRLLTAGLGKCKVQAEQRRITHGSRSDVD